MRPFLKSGGIVSVTASTRYFPGDVVAYNIYGKCYIHRIFKKENKSYFIRDDVNVLKGLWIKESDILGIVHRAPFSGAIGKMWNLFIRNFYCIMRRLKQIVI